MKKWMPGLPGYWAEDNFYYEERRMVPKPKKRVIVPERWWVLRLDGGGYIAVQMFDKPTGQHLKMDGWSIAANRYEVVYGPCSQKQAEDYMKDMEGI